MKGEAITLGGCAPTPLASYLKTLGVLRLISSPANHVAGEAADPHARGWWENECFHIQTTLSREALLHFFLHDYAPSPIIAPWNGRAGFLEGKEQETSKRTGASLMRRFEESRGRRFANLRKTIRGLRSIEELVRYNRLRATTKALKDEIKTLRGEAKKSKDEERKAAEKKEKQSKSVLLPALRSTIEPDHVAYVDACYVLSTDETPMPLLGSGGNDGSRDFGVNFAEELIRLFELDNGSATTFSRTSLDGALFGGGRLRTLGTMGQFSPGQGGSNATTGYEGSNPLNPWDIVLAMEGTIVFAGALTRSWGTVGGSRAAFPFTFEPIGASAAIFSTEDPNRPRCELWTPLWEKPAAFIEIAAIFSEGRLTLGSRTARNGLDAARSVSQIGLSRGISGFERYSIIQPDRKMPYQATPLGRMTTPKRPHRDLIGDLEASGWLWQAQRQVGNKKESPSRARLAMRRLEDALFQMAGSSRASEGTRNALMALGKFIGWLVTNQKAREKLKPPPVLTRDWVGWADDGTPEYRVAVALAALGLPRHLRRQGHDSGVADESNEAVTTTDLATNFSRPAWSRSSIAPPMAAHFAPLDEEKFFHSSGLRLSAHRKWADADTPPTMVWGAGSLVSNMIGVLERRLVEAGIRGLDDKPLVGATAARLADVAAFLSGDFDDARCAALLAGLVWARPAYLPMASGTADECAIPFAYAALKPVFTSNAALHSIGAVPEATRLPVPPGLIARLRAGGGSRDGRATDSAVRLALARARASGLPTHFDGAHTASRRSSGGGGRIGAGVAADRLSAALLIPVLNQALIALITRAYPDALPEGDNFTTEDTSHAA